jgi:membrane-associated phospholipid phosphatase
LCKRLRLVDYMTLACILVNIIFITAGWEAIQDPLPLAGGYAACLLASIAAIAIGDPAERLPPSSRAGRIVRWTHGLLRDAYPMVFLAYFFVAVTFFDTVLFKDDLDPLFMALETSLFGSVPSSWLMIKFESLLLSEILHGSYVLYYATIPGLALWLYARNRKALPEYVTVAMFIFYVTCLTYIVLPVVGGRFDPATKALTEAFRHGPFTRIMAFIYSTSDHAGAAFPSTHAIVSIVIALTARRHARPIATALTANAALIMVATIYCGYHYVADLVGAVVYVAVFYPLGLKLYRRWGATRGPA